VGGESQPPSQRRLAKPRKGVVAGMRVDRWWKVGREVGRVCRAQNAQRMV